MFCPKCGKALENNQKFCDSCGEELHRECEVQKGLQEIKRPNQRVRMKACVNCGTYNPENQVICSVCGKNMDSRQVYAQNDTRNNDNAWIYCCCFLLIIIFLIFVLF